MSWEMPVRLTQLGLLPPRPKRLIMDGWISKYDQTEEPFQGYFCTDKFIEFLFL